MKSLNVFGVIGALALLTACGDGGLIGGTSGGTGGGGTGGGGTGGGGGTVTVDIGSGTPPGFLVGQIGVATSNLAAGGQTSLTVTFVDSNNVLSTDNVDVSFSSLCLGLGSANISPAGPHSTNTGILVVTYTAGGCTGADVINATANVSGVNLATGTVTVAPPTVGSIAFLSATPDQIALQGTGGNETSTVTFTVVDSTGGPVAGVDVDFTPSTTVGGLSLTPTMATSGINGGVQTVVQAGTVATTLRVTATIAALGISTQSSQLTITTGLPDQDSVSLAVQCPNVEAFDYDGVQVPVTVRLGDRYGNPVPDGTAVTFNTEGGKITGACTTITTTNPPESGHCTVNWVSQNPRPANARITIVATATGEETFVDFNQNGIFDDGDTFTDLDEAFRDDNENGFYDPGSFNVGDGFFFDFDISGSYTLGDGLFNGLLCAHSTLCGSTPTVGISDSAVLVMSSSTVLFTRINIGGVDFFPPYAGLQMTAPGSVIFDVSGPQGQPPPEGTVIKLTADNGKAIGATEFTVPCTAFDGPLTYSVFYNTDTSSSIGFIDMKATTPRGLVSPGPIIQLND